METLTPTEAAHLAGAPAAQLHRWAWLGTGPRNVGTKRKPLYLERDVREWLLSHKGGYHVGADETVS